MPSEKSRYIGRSRGPEAPIKFMELKKHLPGLGADRMAELLWIRSDQDNLLRKILTAVVTFHMAPGDFEKAKSAVDFALHFPDYIRYSEGGHGQILGEIQNCLEILSKQGQLEFAIRVAKYTLEKGQQIAENFEDDWDWTSSLNDLENWMKESNYNA